MAIRLTDNERWGLKYSEEDYPHMTPEQVEWSRSGHQKAAEILAHLTKVAAGGIGVDLSKTQADVDDIQAMHNAGLLVYTTGTGDRYVFFK